MQGIKLLLRSDGVNFEELTEVVEIQNLKEYLLKWIPSPNPEHIGNYQLVDMESEGVVIEGSAEVITQYIKDNSLVSECGWVWKEEEK
jgi:hypothetical protein